MFNSSKGKARKDREGPERKGKTDMREQRLARLFEQIEQNSLVQTIRSGLIMMIPILLLGSFSLVFRSLPLDPWQSFLSDFHSGLLRTLFDLLYNGSFGLLSVYMVISISLCYRQYGRRRTEADYGPVITSLACFAVSSGFLTEGFTPAAFNVKGMFLAIFCSLIASWLYEKIMVRLQRGKRLFSDGADVDFDSAASAIIPGTIILLLFSAVNLAIYQLWGFSGLQELFVSCAESIFHGLGRNLGSGLLFVFVSSFLWFLGIHGSDVLDNVSQSLFAEGININAALVAAGGQPTEIVTKTFFDVFVLMGGCGSTLCLLFAMLLFGRQRSSKRLAGMAAFPMLFNINEMMVFGLPVVLNPFFLIPFLLTPVVCTLTSYFAFSSGLVPIPAVTVEWTTPILWGGYVASGSVSGAVLQLFNLAVGTMIYRPFVRQYDLEKSRNARNWVYRLKDILVEGEEKNHPVSLLQLPGQGGRTAKLLAADLEEAIHCQELYFLYQPQVDSRGRCIGAEALLRWNHALTGGIYPPLIIELADESDQLLELEEYVVHQVLGTLEQFRESKGTPFRLCLNVTAKSIVRDEFLDFLAEEAEKFGLKQEGGIEVSLEITEQSALLSKHIEEQFQRIREMGFSLSIDDFSMGFTSLKYLQQSQFSLVKLDGSLVKNLLENPRDQEIIASIVRLSHSLDFDVLAEYVETEEQRKVLERVGCLQYQGYLYSPPVPLEEVLDGAKRVQEKVLS